MDLSRLVDGFMVHMSGMELGSPNTYLHKICNGMMAFTSKFKGSGSSDYNPQFVYTENNLPISICKTNNGKYIVLLNSFFHTSMLINEYGFGTPACIASTIPMTYNVDNTIKTLKQHLLETTIWENVDYLETIPLKDIDSIVTDISVKNNIIISIRNLIDTAFVEIEEDSLPHGVEYDSIKLYKERVEDEIVYLREMW